MEREHEGEIKRGEKKVEKLKHNHLRCFSDDGWMMKEQPGSKRREITEWMPEPLKISREKAELSAGCVCVCVLTCSVITARMGGGKG